MHFTVFGVGVGEVVLHVLGQQMPAIAGGINQHIGCGSSHRTIQNRFQGFVTAFTIFKTQVIAEDDEFFWPTRHHIDNVWQISEVVFVNFNKAQTLCCISIQASFDKR